MEKDKLDRVEALSAIRFKRDVWLEMLEKRGYRHM